MAGGRLELDGLVGVIGNIVDAGRGITTGVSEHRRIHSVGVIRVALQANLVLARHIGANDESTGSTAPVTTFAD